MFSKHATLCSMKPAKTEILGSLQTKIMNIIWTAGRPLKPAEVQSALGDGYAYTTVMTILKRLSEKNILSRKLVGKAFVYSSVCCQQDFVKTNLKDIFGKLVESYGQAAISNFVDVVKSNTDDLRLLEDYLKAHK